MTSELVERLRTRGGRPDGFGLGPICDKAADEIERLTAQLAEARQAERAAVVAWLRGKAEAATNLRYSPMVGFSSCARWTALAIEAGEHLQKEGVLPDE